MSEAVTDNYETDGRQWKI